MSMSDNCFDPKSFKDRLQLLQEGNGGDGGSGSEEKMIIPRSTVELETHIKKTKQ